ncbi:hypothetical protein CAEBREN_16858 [Caenorhabditis brenneri]|uniref:Uncharacterized protein n=1 Tax=Caenorhabditis brenneri TaxID=135651 RepID=G0N339_CAEBE|nr:hypothetical protein CAEBREN_16858 [Caenorhabditis brenneri]
MSPNHYRKVYKVPNFKLKEVGKCSVCQQFKHQQAWYFEKCWECHINPRPAPPVEDVDLHEKFKEFLEKTILEKMGNPDNPIPILQEYKRATVIEKKAKPPKSIEEMKASSQKVVDINNIRKCAACQLFKHEENWNVDICSDCSINGNCSSAVQNSPLPSSQDSANEDIAKKLPEFIMELIKQSTINGQNLIEQLKKNTASPEIIKVSPTTVVAEKKFKEPKKDTGIIKIIGKEHEPQQLVTKCYNYQNKNKSDRDPHDFKPKYRKVTKLGDQEEFDKDFMKYAVSRDYSKYIYLSCSQHTEWEHFLKNFDKNLSNLKYPSVPPPTSNGQPFDIQSLLNVKGSEASKMIMEAGSPEEVMDSLQVATVLANMGSFSSPARSPVPLVASSGPVSPGSGPASSNSSPSPVSSPVRAPVMRSPVLTPIATQTDEPEVPHENPLATLMATDPIMPSTFPNPMFTAQMNAMVQDYYEKMKQIIQAHRRG